MRESENSQLIIYVNVFKMPGEINRFPCIVESIEKNDRDINY